MELQRLAPDSKPHSSRKAIKLRYRRGDRERDLKIGKRERNFNACGKLQNCVQSLIASTELHWLSPKSDPVGHFPKI